MMRSEDYNKSASDSLSRARLTISARALRFGEDVNSSNDYILTRAIGSIVSFQNVVQSKEGNSLGFPVYHISFSDS